MKKDSIRLQNFGPIKDADVTFGDLTILVGPQASGKSLFLEMFKLVKDHSHIISTLKQYNYILSNKDKNLAMDIYFGEGMSALFKNDTRIDVDGEEFDLDSKILHRNNNVKDESVFYIPAQRILSIMDGRPRNFIEFDSTTPYVIRIFSETLRLFIQGGLGNPSVIFPMKTRLKGLLRKSIDDTIFHGAQVVLDQHNGQRKMKLHINDANLPFMTWSAGQKEFMPLLLAVYCLSGPPNQVLKKENYKWVVIEEPEMGLHPRALETVIIEILELMKLGYKVIVSTHSSTLLEFVWAFRNLKESCPEHMQNALCDLFSVNKASSVASLFKDLERYEMNTFYFSQPEVGRVVSKNITTLDVGDEQIDISEWGGLSSFASKASEIVCKYGA